MIQDFAMWYLAFVSWFLKMFPGFAFHKSEMPKKIYPVEAIECTITYQTKEETVYDPREDAEFMVALRDLKDNIVEKRQALEAKRDRLKLLLKAMETDSQKITTLTLSVAYETRLSNFAKEAEELKKLAGSEVSWIEHLCRITSVNPFLLMIAKKDDKYLKELIEAQKKENLQRVVRLELLDEELETSTRIESELWAIERRFKEMAQQAAEDYTLRNQPKEKVE